MADEPFDDLFEPVEGEPPTPSVQQTVPVVSCPSCGTANDVTNRHCLACGARISQGPLPMAPQPLLRTTAGSRALIVTAAVIAVVLIIALLFNIFSSDDEPGDTTVATNGTQTTTETTVTPPSNGETVQVIPNRVLASGQLTDFPADNLIDSDPLTMWQVGQQGEGATVTFFFPETVALERIEFKNIDDEEKYRRNFRVRGIRISPDDTTRAVVQELADTRDVQVIPIQTTATNTVRLEVQSTYPAESVEDLAPFSELAIENLEFFGSVVGS